MLQWGVFTCILWPLDMLHELLHLVTCMWSPCTSNKVTVEGAFIRKKGAKVAALCTGAAVSLSAEQDSRGVCSLHGRLTQQQSQLG